MMHDSKVCHDEDDIDPRKSPGWVGCGKKKRKHEDAMREWYTVGSPACLSGNCR